MFEIEHGARIKVGDESIVIATVESVTFGSAGLVFVDVVADDQLRWHFKISEDRIEGKRALGYGATFGTPYSDVRIDDVLAS